MRMESKNRNEGTVLLQENEGKKGEKNYERTNNSRGTESNTGERK
jgi:hypothetical protein